MRNRISTVVALLSVAVALSVPVVLSSCTTVPASGDASVQQAPSPADQAKPLKYRKIVEYIRLTHCAEMAVNMYLDSIDKSNLSAEEKALYRKHATVLSMEQALTEVYMKVLSDEEVNALLKFYSSEEGRSFLSKQGAIMQESGKVGTKWCEDIKAKVEADRKK